MPSRSSPVAIGSRCSPRMVPPRTPVGLAANLKGCDRVTSIPFAIPKSGTPAFAAALARSWFSRYPVDLWKCQVPDAAEAKCGRRWPVAWTYAWRISWSPIPNMPWPSPVPTILFEHNVEYMIWKRLHDVEPQPLAAGPAGSRMAKDETLRGPGVPTGTAHAGGARTWTDSFWPPARLEPTSARYPRESTRHSFTRTGPRKSRTRWSSPDPWTGIPTRMRSCTSWKPSFLGSVASSRESPGGRR